MVSPYLLRPIRSFEQAVREIAERQKVRKASLGTQSMRPASEPQAAPNDAPMAENPGFDSLGEGIG
jgi:hypothetical protein